MTSDMALDRIDYGILHALQNDGRLSNKELAARVGLAPSSCLERVRKLEGRGVLQGYHARVAIEALGIRLQAIVYVELGRHTRSESDSFELHIRDFPEVVGIFNVAGRWDYLLHVAVPNVERLKCFTQEALSARPEVGRVETSLVFDHERRHSLVAWEVPGDL
jgi:DNA-binding Lrp family transcriptional regulator